MCIRDSGTFEVSPVISATLFGNGPVVGEFFPNPAAAGNVCLLYTSDAADERSSVDLGGRRIIKKKNNLTQPDIGVHST